MKLQPVKRCPPPGYPTQDILGEHPELLRLVPERWRANPLVLGVLAGTLSLLTACRQQQPRPPAGGGTAPAPAIGPVDTKGSAQPAAAGKSLVAPLFIHGEGRGALGCVVVNPAVFLGEDEARAVIRDEARKAGIEFAEDVVSIAAVETPMTNSPADPPGWGQTEGDHRKQRTTRKLPLTLDGAEQRTGIGYEYISWQDADLWLDPDASGRGSTLSEYYIRDTAEVLRHGLVMAAPTRALGVFYDPMASAALPGSEELLRQQVRDFIAWLKAQGVI